LTFYFIIIFCFSLFSGESARVSQEATGDSFTTFVNDGNHLSNNVRVVHVQTVPDGNNSNNSTAQGNNTVNSGMFVDCLFP